MLNIRLNLRSLTLKPDSEGHFVVRISSDSDKVPELCSQLVVRGGANLNDHNTSHLHAAYDSWAAACSVVPLNHGA